MKKIKQILVPTDFSDAALNAFRYAIWLADKYEADIHLLHVLGEEAVSEEVNSGNLKAEENKNIAQQKMKTFMDAGMLHVAHTIEFDYIPIITSEMSAGIPTEQIEKVVKEKNIDLVIMGAKGASGSLEEVMGSVTASTLEKVDCSILLVPKKAVNRKIQTVAYATDLSEADPYYIWRTGKLLATFNPIIRVVHVEKKKQEERVLTMSELQDFFEEHPIGLSTTFHTISAKSRKEQLTDFETAWEVDLLVMSKPRRGFFEGLFHTSVTRQMAVNTIVPLLVLKV